MNKYKNIISLKKSSHFFSINSQYLEYLYEQYLLDPTNIELSWRKIFNQITQSKKDISHSEIRNLFIKLSKKKFTKDFLNIEIIKKYNKVLDLIYAYRSIGHKNANIDPIKLYKKQNISYLKPCYYGLSEKDMDSYFLLQESIGCNNTPKKLVDIISILNQCYCKNIGYEYMHISNYIERNWIKNRIENIYTQSFDNLLENKVKINLLKYLIYSDSLEKFLGIKYVGQKRFSLEGADGLIPILKTIISETSKNGVKELIMAMAHRGRLNVLVNVMGKIPSDLFKEFEGKYHKSLLSGDVKYHNGFSSNILLDNKKIMHMELAFNPSHLEIVSPVVEGLVRAKQTKTFKEQILAIHIHGDSAFSGQGVVMEMLNMSQTRGFSIGGAIHIIINNQIGFTTSNISDTRSSYYCSDIAKMTELPVFHVNGDDPESIYKATKIAIEYQNSFHKDVIIDLVCYRKNGHNEADEPSTTQPLMYKIIKNHPAPSKIYADKLIKMGIISKYEYYKIIEDYKNKLSQGEAIVNCIYLSKDKEKLYWKSYKKNTWRVNYKSTVEKKKLDFVAKKINYFPENFILQRQVHKTIEERERMRKSKIAINWGYAELLAYGTLVYEGYGVRICGEDVERGTFSHRHAVLYDQNTGNSYIPLKHINNNQNTFEIVNSLLSEEAVMAYEYGYSTADSNILVIWEAQFGDFSNCAQVVIDQFISSAEEKWGKTCGITLFLPHGQEGMGAEHSSARLERFLQLCAHNNIQVCVPTNPSQHFHLIRRQIVRPYRKPLVVMTPKSLLRNPMVTSSFNDFYYGNFCLILDEIDYYQIDKITCLILCQGKIYYDLLSKRRSIQKEITTCIVRIEQLYPFPDQEFQKIIFKYSLIKDIIWCQEEPKNQGAWYIMQNIIKKFLIKNQKLTYIGRDSFASPAAGYPSLYHKQQDKIIFSALNFSN